MKRNIFNLVKKAYSLYIQGVSYISPTWASRIAFKLFKTPRGKVLTANQIEWLHKRKVGSIEVEGKKCFYYHIKGTGDSILLAHGWESNAYRWRKYVERLSALGYNIYLIDAPGHGLSEGKEFTPIAYAQALNKLCLKYNFDVLIGHSVGGYATIYAIGELPTPPSLKKAILMAPTNKLRIMMGSFYDALSLNQKTINSYEMQFIKSYGHPYEYFHGDSMLKNCTLPGLIIHDKGDTILPYSYSYELQKSWKNSELIITEGFGHRLLGEDIYDIIIEYLK